MKAPFVQIGISALIVALLLYALYRVRRSENSENYPEDMFYRDYSRTGETGRQGTVQTAGTVAGGMGIDAYNQLLEDITARKN